MIESKPTLFHYVYSWILSIAKAFVDALSSVVWLFAGVLIIGAAILYLIKSGDLKTLTELPKGLGFLLDIFRNYWTWFFIAIFFYYLIINYKEIRK